MCWELWHPGMLDRALTQQVNSWEPGQGACEASCSPEKQIPCSSVHISACPGDSWAVSMRKSSRVPQWGPCRPNGGAGSHSGESDVGVFNPKGEFFSGYLGACLQQTRKPSICLLSRARVHSGVQGILKDCLFQQDYD